MNLTRTLDADSESISLSEVKNHLRISGSSDDEALSLFLTAIRHKTESYLGKTLITSTWQYELDAFEDVIELPMIPVASISSIAYVDTAGANQAFTDFQFDRRGRLKPSYDNSWPDTRAQFDAVTITYVAGDSDAQADIKLAMLLWVGACDIAREGVVIGTTVTELPEASKSLLAPHRRIKL